MGIHRALPDAEIIGVDIVNQPRYPFQFRLANAMHYPLEGFDFIWASPPCQEFAVWGLRMFFPDPPYPTNGLRMFNGTRERLENNGRPFVMENVNAAQQFVGRAINHLGPFYLWGNFVPAIFPPEFRDFKKGFGGLGRDPRTGKRIISGARQFGSKSQKRKEFTQTISMVPPELTEYIMRQWP